MSSSGPAGKGHQSRGTRARLLFLTVLVSAVLVLLAARLFSLQVVQGLRFQQMAEAVARRELPVFARRGEIFDRKYDIPLVTNASTYAIDVVPGDLPSERRGEVLARLAEALNVPLPELEGRLPPLAAGVHQPVEVAGDVPFERIAYLSERLEEFPGVTWHVKPLRSYDETGSIVHVIGYVGGLTEEEYQVNYGRGYNRNSVIGKSGVEKQYDEVLRGRDGRQFYMADARGRNLADLEEQVVPPSPGNDVVLTIDARIQRLAERALGKRVGSVVVLKPATGEVLAMVSYPFFDPNVFYTADGSARFAQLSLDRSYPFINRAMRAQYPPASVFKIVDAAAIIAEQPFSVTHQILCQGKMDYGGRIWNCHLKEGHGYLDLMGGLAQSCDIYFWNAAIDLGVDTIVRYTEEFGLGKRSGIDLPGEWAGFVPTPDWKKRVKHVAWFGGDTLNMAIGQGDLQVTPLQMADMVALVANSGVIYRPHVVKEIRDPESGAVVGTVAPEVIHRSDLPKEVYPILQEAMRGVITKGTANVVITTKAVEVAGKTGTSETGGGDHPKSDSDYWHSWFAAYGPYRPKSPEEQVVVVVMCEASENWEWWAPKAANAIFQGIFADQDFDEAIAALNAPWLYPPEAIR
jgi:penicillin-binding protein 2